MQKGKLHIKSLRDIQRALDSAIEQKLVTNEGYDQIRAVIVEKMKKKSSGLEMADTLEEAQPPPPPEAEECIVVEECIVTEKDEPGNPYQEASDEPVPVEESTGPHCIDAPQDQAPDAEEWVGVKIPEPTVNTASLSGDADTIPRDKSGFGFTWCIRCARVDVILYGSKTLPIELRGAESQLDNGIATIMCGCSKPEGGRNGWGEYTDGGYGYSGDVDFRSSFEKLRLSPTIFEGSEVAEAARTILAVKVAFITVNDGVAFKDIDEIVRGLTVEDRMMSVDMKGFREGKRENLLLPYLAGGLTR
jgi:hypothetical protein